VKSTPPETVGFGTIVVVPAPATAHSGKYHYFFVDTADNPSIFAAFGISYKSGLAGSCLTADFFELFLIHLSLLSTQAGSSSGIRKIFGPFYFTIFTINLLNPGR
jgi:hypothetical protein